jgi:serine/threonine protein kinase/Flp pilus assembly protein TadD
MLQGPTVATGAAGFPRVFGNVVLLKPLSRDPRTEVFLAQRNEGADRLCVVTFLGASLVANPKAIEALRAQANWLVGRMHGNLVQIYDVGQSGDQLFFVNEYVEGVDLGATLARAGVLPPGVATFAALEAGEALTFLRAQEEAATGIKTRVAGLSVSSLMLARDGKVKLLHMGSGLAAPSEGLIARGPGVVSLIAPEELSGPSSAAGDVYAVGALLWQMLTGRPLAGSDAALHVAELRAGRFQPRAPSSVAGPDHSIPESLDALVLSALAPQIEKRPESFQAFRTDLVAVMKTLTDTDERGVRRLVVDTFSADLNARANELAKLTASASRTGDAPPQAPSLTLTNISGVKRRRAPETELVPGHTIPGTRYRALEKLGEGGMGAVYLAEHVDIERKVALKLLHSDLVQNPLVLRQFRQEARAASRIGNPYICDVTDWGEVEDGRVFFVMEYLDGASLGTVLKEERRFSPARIIPIIRQVAKALGAAHEKGIVHLDVKPDNVLLLEKDGRQDGVKVVDFGIAGLLGQGSGGGKVMGTPEYMAPERAQGFGYDHRSDVYSLGVMMYEMLTGEVPLQAATPVETLALQVDEKPDRINERLTEPVPEKIESLVMRMLEKDPGRRPQSMAEVESSLLEAQIDARITTPWDEELTLPPMESDRAARITRRLSPTARSQRVSLLAVSGVAALSVGLTLFIATREPEPTPPTTRLSGIEVNAAGTMRPPGSAGSPGGQVVAVMPTPAANAPVVEPMQPPPGAQPGPAENTAPGGVATTTGRAPDGIDPAVERARNEALRKRRETAAAVVPREPLMEGRRVASREAVSRGEQALKASRYTVAAKEFNTAIESDPSNARAYAGLAQAEWENARYEESLRAARQAAQREPGIATHHVLVGDAAVKLGRQSEAVRAYERAATLKPSDTGIRDALEFARAGRGGR